MTTRDHIDTIGTLATLVVPVVLAQLLMVIS